MLVHNILRNTANCYHKIFIDFVVGQMQQIEFHFHQSNAWTAIFFP